MRLNCFTGSKVMAAQTVGTFFWDTLYMKKKQIQGVPKNVYTVWKVITFETVKQLKSVIARIKSLEKVNLMTCKQHGLRHALKQCVGI